MERFNERETFLQRCTKLILLAMKFKDLKCCTSLGSKTRDSWIEFFAYSKSLFDNKNLLSVDGHQRLGSSFFNFRCLIGFDNIKDSEFIVLSTSSVYVLVGVLSIKNFLRAADVGFLSLSQPLVLFFQKQFSGCHKFRNGSFFLFSQTK
jgi:hypothetical protein